MVIIVNSFCENHITGNKNIYIDSSAKQFLSKQTKFVDEYKINEEVVNNSEIIIAEKIINNSNVKIDNAKNNSNLINNSEIKINNAKNNSEIKIYNTKINRKKLNKNNNVLNYINNSFKNDYG